VHKSCRGFALLPPRPRPVHLGRGEARAGVEPARHHFPRREHPRFARKVDKNRLRHLLGRVRIAAQMPQRRRVNQVHMPVHDLREGRLRAFVSVAAEQLRVTRHGVCHYSPVVGKTEQESPSSRSLAQHMCSPTVLRMFDKFLRPF
jgi:hypothetical protein